MIRERVDALVCDLDGVIYRGDDVIEGAPEAIAELRVRGSRVIFWTNNSRATVAQYAAKLGRMGIETEPDDILTSAIVTAAELARRGYEGRRALVIGGPGIREALGEVGIEVVGDGEAADVVVVGWDLDFSFDSMRAAARVVESGAPLIATNDDAAYPAPDGLWPGTGAILASIEVASGRRGEVMGKPHRPMVEAVAARLAGSKRIAAVGDRPETDLAGAPERGWMTILVLSGVTAPEDADRVSPRPDLIVDSIAALPHVLDV
ncbi:MAG TPA: HAD-IIA family hydrolase [Actinomycetota bacterium]|nr:HAD-IIA family hydrolase [Actinomycetota bacterium]